MKRVLLLLTAFLLTVHGMARSGERWPDGQPIDRWFADTALTAPHGLGNRYVITDFGVLKDSTLVQTKAIQRVIDEASDRGGGVVVIPDGTFLSGSLFIRKGVNLQVEAGGKLKGSDRIEDFPIMETRIEGQTCQYFAALINADQTDGFILAGPGTIDGNGLNYWKEFWLRRQWNPDCTNKDAQRPRLVYISRASNVRIENIRLQNSPFWTTHLYRCRRVKMLRCSIFAPTEGVKAPSSDAIDVDVCSDIHVYGCHMSVNDDAVALKGGKGTWADRAPENGSNERILIENCHYRRVHSCLTLGSESVHDRNVILRKSQCDDVNRVLWLKMRPDTPQRYEYVRVSEMRGNTGSFIVVRPWTQFFSPEARPDMPLSSCQFISMERIDMACWNFFDVGLSDKYDLRDFSFTDIKVSDRKNAFNPTLFEGIKVKNLTINNQPVP